MSTRQPPIWQLHDAKARFSELFKRARADGAQRVVKHGGESVVIIPAEEFDRITARAGQPATLAEFFRAAPTGGKPLDLSRNRDVSRTIKW